MAAAFSPDGKLIVTGHWITHIVQLWDAATLKPVGKPFTARGQISVLAFGTDGRSVFIGYFGDKQVPGRFWDVATQKEVGPSFSHTPGIWGVAFSPDGKLILTGGPDWDGRLWDAATGQQIGKAFHHRGEVRPVAFDPDGRSILTGSYDKTARLWNLTTGAPLASRSSIRCRCRWRVSARTAGLWSPEAGMPWRSCGEREREASGAVSKAFSQSRPFGPWTAQADPHWSRPKRGRFRSGKAARGNCWANSRTRIGIRAAAVSPGGKLALTGTADGMASLWEVSTGKRVHPSWHHQEAIALFGFSRDGKTIVTGGREGEIRFVEMASGKFLGTSLQLVSAVTAVAFSPAGKSLLIGCEDGSLHLRDVVLHDLSCCP